MKRRDFIAAAAAATAAAGTIPAAAATSDPDAAFLDLWREFEAARAELAENSARYKAAYDSLPEWAKGGPDGGGPEWSEEEMREIGLQDYGIPRRLHREQVVTINHNYLEQLRLRYASPAILEMARQENAGRLEAFDRKIAERDRLQQAAGLPAIEAEGDEIYKRVWGIETAIAEREARGPVGLYVKLSLLDYIHEQGSSIERHNLAPILADLRRMTGMGRLTPPADEEAEVTA